MTSDQILYEVRYPDGHTVRLSARRVSVVDGDVTLFDTWRASAPNIIFHATPSSGVTVTRVDTAEPSA